MSNPLPSASGDRHADLLDDAILERAVAARIEARERRARASELATWTGVLRDLAERRTAVAAQVAGGRVHRGRLVAVARDHLLLSLDAGGFAALVVDTVRSIRPEPGTGAEAPAGDRPPAQDRVLAELLQDLVDGGRRVALVLRDVAEPVTGNVTALGDDLLTVRVSGPGGGVLHLPITAVAAVLVEP